MEIVYHFKYTGEPTPGMPAQMFAYALSRSVAIDIIKDAFITDLPDHKFNEDDWGITARKIFYGQYFFIQ